MGLLYRRSKRDDPHLEWKVRLFTVAAVAGILGIYFDERWMGAVAIALLAVALALTVIGGRAAATAEGDADDRVDGVEDDDDDVVPGA